MARTYLPVGGKQIPVTEEQVKLLNRFRFDPTKIREITADIIAGTERKHAVTAVAGVVPSD